MSTRTAMLEVPRVGAGRAWGQVGRRAAASGDRAVWDRLRAGDEGALEELFRRHINAVYNFAFRRTSSWATAEDVVQATFLAVWRRACSGKLDRLQLESARPFLLVVAGNECGTLLRSSRRQDAVRKRIQLIDHDNQVPDYSAGVVARVDDERAMSDIRRILDKIPVKQREVVELVVWSRCSMADAAQVLGIPEGTVKSRLSRARASLAGLIDLDTLGRLS